MQGSDEVLVQRDIDGLVVRAQSGDTHALAALYDHFYGRIHRYVAFKTGSLADAEDIAEEVFLRMLEHIRTYRPQGVPFSAWLFRIAHNLVVDYFRKRSRHWTVPLEAALPLAAAPSTNPDERLDAKLAMREVSRAMEDLTDLQREVITLRFAAGLSVKETARAVGKKENAVKALQHSGIRKLRSLLVPAGRPVHQPAVWQV